MNESNDIIYGIRTLQEAIIAGKTISKVMFKKGLSGDQFHALLRIVQENNIPFQYVPIEKLNRTTRKNHQGVIAFTTPVEFQKIEDIIPFCFENGKTPMVLLLDEISDVRNFGAICRTAECAGVDAVVIPDKGAAAINSDAVKTSAGALSVIPVCRTASLKSTIRFLKDSGLQIVAADEKSDKNFYETDLTGPIAFLMGSEDRGIHPENLRYADHIVKIFI